MRLHAKVTLSELPLEWDDLSFQLRSFPSYPTFLRYLKECLSRLGSFALFHRFPHIRLPNNRSQKVRAHGRIRSVQDLEASWPLNAQITALRISK